MVITLFVVLQSLWKFSFFPTTVTETIVVNGVSYALQFLPYLHCLLQNLQITKTKDNFKIIMNQKVKAKDSRV